MRDVIVVGAGGGGPIVAKELAARGLDVVLLEAGNRFANPEEDFTHFENDMNNPILGTFRFGPPDRTKPPWVRDLPQNSAILQGAGVGGTTVFYSSNSPRAMPGAFGDYEGWDADAYDSDHLFPLCYRELLPYYEWVEETLPVQTAAMGTKEEAFFRGATRLGLPVQTTKDITRAAFRPQENAILQPQGNAGKTADLERILFPHARGCTFCGHCFQGCMEPLHAPVNLKAKRSTNNSYVPMALTADLWSGGRAATLIPDAFAVRINTDGGSVARSVTWRVGSSGELLTEEAHVIVLACGAVETPRLWLNSQLPNPNGWVGRGLTDHFSDLVLGIMPVTTDINRGPTSTVRVDYPGFGMLENIAGTPGFAGFTAFSDAGIAGFYDNGIPFGPQGADSMGRLVGPALKDLLANLDRLLTVLIYTDDDVEPDNRVLLSETLPPDEHGPVARIEIQHRNRSPRTQRNREFLVRESVRLLREGGALRVHRVHWPPVFTHMHSTMRMGLGESNSVLDENAESRWVSRLFIADNSGLANGVGGPNPTLTTQALATRTAEKIFQRYFGGEGWVAKEAPFSSVDPRVTRAVIERGL